MNTWFVGSHPIGHLIRYNDASNNQDGNSTDGEPLSKPASTTQDASNEDTALAGAPPTISGGEKTFFMKARIFAGQADLKANKMDVEDFKWLAKDEVQKYVTPSYWSRIKNMLVDQ